MDKPPRDEMMELAAKCEAASGSDREIDEAIAQHREPGLFCRDEHGRLRKNMHGTPLNPQWDLWHAPAYTASLDAAMTLVPEGCDVTLDVEKGRGGAIVFDDLGIEAIGRCYAATPALALCAASLRAISATRGVQE